MEKLITIDGKEMRMVANGATPRIYRILFGKDLFKDINTAIDEKTNELLDTSVLEQLAFVAGRQGGSIETSTTIEEWLESLDDPMAIINVAGALMELWAANRKTTSTPKKKNDRSTVK